MRQPQTAFNTPIHLDNEFNLEAIKEIVVLDNGDFIVSGLYIDYDAPIDGDSVYVAKFNQYGTLQWQNKIAALPDGINAAGHAAKGLTIVNDSLIVVLEFIQSSLIQPEFEYWLWDSYVHFFDMEGDFLYTKEPQASFYAHDFERIKWVNGKIILLGTGISNTNVVGNYDWLMISMDLDGNTLQELTIHDSEQLNVAADILELSDGRVVLATRNKNASNDYTSFQLHCVNAELNEILWSKTYDDAIPFSISEGINGDILLGISELEQVNTQTYAERAIYSVDPDYGWLNFSENYKDGGNYQEYVFGIYQKEDGSIYMGGMVAYEDLSEFEAYLMKINPDLSVGWERKYKCFDEQYEEYINDMVVTPDGGFLLGGWSRGIDEQREEIWLIKTDSLGNDSIAIGAYFLADTLFLNHNDSIILNPIPYGGANAYTHNWQGATSFLNADDIWYPTFIASQAGTFQLSYTATDTIGNHASANLVIVVSPSVGIENVNYQPDFLVYPNPAKDVLHISTPKGEDFIIEIYSSDGRQLINANSHRSQQIDISNLPNGILHIQIIGVNGHFLGSTKVIKQ